MWKWKKIDYLSNLLEYKPNFLDSVHKSLASPLIRFYLIGNALINLFTWAIAYYIDFKEIGDAREVVALHYNIDFGVNEIGPLARLYVLPALGLLVYLTNFIIIVLVNKRASNKFITHLMLASALAANVFLLLAIYSLYLINFTA